MWEGDYIAGSRLVVYFENGYRRILSRANLMDLIEQLGHDPDGCLLRKAGWSWWKSSSHPCESYPPSPRLARGPPCVVDHTHAGHGFFRTEVWSGRE